MAFQSETEFQKWCNKELEKLNIHYVHIPQKNKYVREGILDLMCWYRGKSFIIELKIKGNYLTTEQKKEKKKFEEQKIPVYIIYTANDFFEIIEKEIVC